MKKKILLGALGLLLSVSLLACAAPAPTPTPPAPAPAPPAPVPKPAPKVEEVFKLKFSTAYPPPYYSSVPLAYWMDELERLSGGRLIFERFWGGALGAMIEHLDMVKGGVIDLGIVNFGAHPAKFPLYGFNFAWPFSSNDPSVGTKAMWTMVEEFPDFAEKPAAAQNQKFLTMFSTDTYDIISPKPMLTLADFKGKVIGAWGKYMPMWVEPLGAKGAASPAVDRYLLMKDGVIDASLLLTTAKVDLKHYEVAKHLLRIEMGTYTADNVAINLDTWRKLPPDLQRLILDEARLVSIEYHPIRARFRMKEAVAVLEKQGVSIHIMSAEDKVKWLEMMPDYPAEWAKEMAALGLPGWEIAKRWIEVNKAYFHEWPRAWAVKK